MVDGGHVWTWRVRSRAREDATDSLLQGFPIFWNILMTLQFLFYRLWLFLDAVPLHSAVMNHLGLQSSMHEKDCEIERQSEKTQPVKLWGLQKWRTGWGLKKVAKDPRAWGEVPGWSLLGKPLCFRCKHSCVVTYTLLLLRREMNSELLRMLQVTWWKIW